MSSLNGLLEIAAFVEGTHLPPEDMTQHVVAVIKNLPPADPMTAVLDQLFRSSASWSSFMKAVKLFPSDDNSQVLFAMVAVENPKYCVTIMPHENRTKLLLSLFPGWLRVIEMPSNATHLMIAIIAFLQSVLTTA